MTDTCTNPGGRDETIVAYLYDDIDPASRAAFEAHMVSCAACRAEVDALRGVRRSLARWSPPEPAFVEPRTTNVEPPTTSDNRQSWWREIPAWAQVAAALLFLGVAAGLANLNVRYDSSGLTVRTGWMPSAPAAVPAPTSADAKADGVSRAELVALEQRVRGELRALQTSTHALQADNAQPLRTSSDADLLRRVRALVDESEKRQQSELALRVGAALRDVDSQRRADLARIDRSLGFVRDIGVVQQNLGVEVLKQRDLVNRLIQVNQHP